MRSTLAIFITSVAMANVPCGAWQLTEPDFVSVRELSGDRKLEVIRDFETIRLFQGGLS